MFGFVFWVLILGLSVVEVWCLCSVCGFWRFGVLDGTVIDCGLCVCIFFFSLSLSVSTSLENLPLDFQ